MNATNINYGELRKAYPKVMSKEQFRIAAHISKATALYLLESGHVPCQDTHKKTHRYLIKTADVISYLINREIEPEKYLASNGWYEERSGSKHEDKSIKNELLQLSPTGNKLLRKFYEGILCKFDDVLTVAEVAVATGYAQSAITSWCRCKALKAFVISGKYCIPKICVVDFLTSPKAHCIRHKANLHQKYTRLFLEKLQSERLNTSCECPNRKSDL